MKKFTILLLTIFTFTLLATGCSTINENSKNYSEHSLKYLVNNSNLDEGEEVNLDELKNQLKDRLNKFEVNKVEIIENSEDNKQYLTVNFGTIDEISDIRKWLELDTEFNIKKKIIDDSDFETVVKNKAEAALEEVKVDGASFEMIAQNNAMIDPERVFYSRSNFMFKNEIKDIFIDPLFSLEPGEINDEVLYYEESPFVLAKPIKIGSIIKLFDTRDFEKVKKQDKEINVSHILVAYSGAMRADEKIERTKEEALNLSKEIQGKLDNGESFESLALKYSDDAANKGNGGVLEAPAGKGTYVGEFEEAALNELTEVDQITSPVETPFGFHLIKAREIIEESEEKTMEKQVNFGVIFFAEKPVEWELTEMDGNYVSNTTIFFDEQYKPFIEVRLNDDGKTLLHTLTEQNDKEILGVFVGNELITSFTVKEVNGSGIITVKTPANTKEADIIKEKFDLKPLSAPIIFIEDSADKSSELPEEPEQE